MIGFGGAFGVEWVRQGADAKSALKLFQRSTLLELQDISAAFLRTMTGLYRNSAPGTVPPPTYDIDLEQDKARDQLNRIRVLGSRVADRQVEILAAAVFHAAYGALAARTSMHPAYDAWEALNDYIGRLLR